MDPIQIVLAVATVLCSLVAGLVFAFAIVIMPGIKSLEDRDYLKAFAVMDRVIQNNQPVFIFVWIGSAFSVITLLILSFWQLEGAHRVWAIVLPAIYLVGVQLPTIIINIPLNNRLQSLDLNNLSQSELSTIRKEFESRWTYSNSFRTIVATFVTTGLVILALKL